MRYWIGVASEEHVARGMAGGFCQLCHGKAQALKRMRQGDWIIYYSPRKKFSPNSSAELKDVCQKFTAIGRVAGDEVYAFEMAPGFIPFRRDVDFLPAQAIDIRPLIHQLNFIQNKSRWGYAFRFGHLEISQADFELIASGMLAEGNLQPLMQTAISA